MRTTGSITSKSLSIDYRGLIYRRLQLRLIKVTPGAGVCGVAAGTIKRVDASLSFEGVRGRILGNDLICFEGNPMLREEYVINNVEQLRQLFGDTSERIWAKATDTLSEPMRRFISLSPFCCITSHDLSGKSDISPRGDAPGFVKAVNGRTLILPDRPGNRRYDTFRNIFDVPEVSLLFVIPGVFDTLRVNGRARVSYDPALLEQFAVAGKLPKIVTVITVDEAYGHCSKAIRRSRLWEKDFKIDPKTAPSLLEMMSAHLSMDDEELRETDQVIERDIVDFMY